LFFFEDAYILVCSKKLDRLKEIVPILEKVSKLNKPLLIIAEDFDNEVVTALVINNIRFVLKVVAVKAPGFGDRKLSLIEDISILTGFKLTYNSCLNKLRIKDLGRAKKIIVYKESTTIIGGYGKKFNIKKE